MNEIVKVATEMTDWEIDDEIKYRWKRVASDIFRLKELLTERRKRIPHGQWVPYLESIGVPRSTADYWMNYETRRENPSREIEFQMSNVRHLKYIETSPRPRSEVPFARELPGLRIVAQLDKCRDLLRAVMEEGRESITDEDRQMLTHCTVEMMNTLAEFNRWVANQPTLRIIGGTHDSAE